MPLTVKPTSQKEMKMGWLGALVGAAIDRRDGDSGLKGALIGASAGRVLKSAMPIAAAATLGWIALSLLRHRRAKPDDGQVTS
jgi:hypothetical protein